MIPSHISILLFIAKGYIIILNESSGEICSAYIEKYKKSDIYIFKDFASHLEKFKEQIIASFKDYDVPVKEKEREELHRRLSNGPMEGFNRKPKDLKRTSRGFDNFNYTRNRILWSERKDAHILAVPKKLEDVQTKTGNKRGPYNKNK